MNLSKTVIIKFMVFLLVRMTNLNNFIILFYFIIVNPKLLILNLRVTNIFWFNEEFCSILVFNLVFTIERFLLINWFWLNIISSLSDLIYFIKIFNYQATILRRFLILLWGIILEWCWLVINSIWNWNFLETIFFVLNLWILIFINYFFFKLFLIFFWIVRRFIWFKQIFLIIRFFVVILVLIRNTCLALLLRPWLFRFIDWKILLIILIFGRSLNWCNLTIIQVIFIKFLFWWWWWNNFISYILSNDWRQNRRFAMRVIVFLIYY